MLGGLSAAANRQLNELARKWEKSDLGRLRTVSLRPGARLIREWDGETHEVLVVDDGFQWRGQIWASLSAIERDDRHALVRSAVLRSSRGRSRRIKEARKSRAQH